MKLTKKQKEKNHCTFAPEFNFTHCCKKHDVEYAQGKTSLARKLADVRFRECIKQAGHPIIARVYYLFVRLFGWISFRKNN